MSEKSKQHFEHQERLQDSHELDANFKVEQEAKMHEAEVNQAEQLENARHEVHEESAEKDNVLNRLKVEQEPETDDLSRRPVGGDLKKITFQKEMTHIRRKLSKPDRIGSKIIHQPIIRTVSEVSAKTITRPSGLLGGGITAFLGTGVYLYLTKSIGVKYNYSIFLFLLVAGFILGLLIEALVRITRGKRAI